MKASKILILHYRDTLKYPPILNFIHFLTVSKKISLKYISAPRLVFADSNLNRFFNTLAFLSFTFHSFLALMLSKRDVIYYESISATPVFLYFFLFRGAKKRLFIHYHEYFSKKDYEKQSLYERLGRRLEERLFKKAVWISHTNKHRLSLFKEEFPYLNDEVLKIMPNYPPSAWLESNMESAENQASKTRLLHIGSLSKRGLYLEELLNSLGNHPNFNIDFYSHKFTAEVKDLITSYDNCQVCGSIAYHDIPSLRGKYDVGLVLYNGSSLNFTYNAPNKIFEYLALGLDVWCSDKLITAKDYERLDCYPKIILLDYEQLDHFDVEKALDKTGLPYVPSPYVCEPVYEKFLDKIYESSRS